MPRAFTGTYAPDAGRIAYQAIATALIAEWAQDQFSQWRHYRGGRTQPIRVMSLADHSVEKLPWTNSNDTDPMWVGNTVYFRSDRNGEFNIFKLGIPGAKGELIDSQAAVTISPVEWIGLSAGYRYYRILARDTDSNDRADWLQKGPYVSVMLVPAVPIHFSLMR